MSDQTKIHRPLDPSTHRQRMFPARICQGQFTHSIQERCRYASVAHLAGSPPSPPARLTQDSHGYTTLTNAEEGTHPHTIAAGARLAERARAARHKAVPSLFRKALAVSSISFRLGKHRMHSPPPVCGHTERKTATRSVKPHNRCVADWCVHGVMDTLAYVCV